MRIIFGSGLSNLVIRCWGSLAVPRHAPLMPSALLPHTVFNLTAFDDEALKRLHIQACKDSVTVSKGFPSAIQKPGLQNPILSQFLKLKVTFLTEDIYLFYFFLKLPFSFNWGHFSIFIYSYTFANKCIFMSVCKISQDAGAALLCS